MPLLIMGVPGFFLWILKNFNDNGIIQKTPAQTIDALYLDANCLIHPQCAKIMTYFADNSAIGQYQLENFMISRVCNYIQFLINTVKPQKEVFISVDGVAPLAKMNQQRKRRFKSAADRVIVEDIKSRHQKPFNNTWNNSTITPGTQFMERLNKSLVRMCRRLKGVKVTYSSYHTPGEGEHKILQHLKQRPKEDVSVIYGLDADLFFLAMASQRDNIHLLREEIEFGGLIGVSADKETPQETKNIVRDVDEPLCFVSIDETKGRVNEYIQSIANNTTKRDYINDFILICFLLGNDFLPHIPSLDIKNHGMDIVLDAYVKNLLPQDAGIVLLKDGKVTINMGIFRKFICHLAGREHGYFVHSLPRYLENMGKKECPHVDPYDREIWEWENLKNIVRDDPIQLGVGNSEDYKFRYYEHYFQIIQNQRSFVWSASHQYLVGIWWTTKYYFETCPSWDWQYAFLHAPFMSDISRVCDDPSFDINKLGFKWSQPVTPFVQLLAVLPPSSHSLLPKSYQHLMTHANSSIIDLFPVQHREDTIGKTMNWKCVPLIPPADIVRIQAVVQNLEKDSDEAWRDTLKDNMVFAQVR